ncbi:MAG: hypothetical protein HQM12_04095 [SAR324 cluster bacterium]|nr:hypothetical protein [SAR324 cluster bacterium]
MPNTQSNPVSDIFAVYKHPKENYMTTLNLLLSTLDETQILAYMEEETKLQSLVYQQQQTGDPEIKSLLQHELDHLREKSLFLQLRQEIELLDKKLYENLAAAETTATQTEPSPFWKEYAVEYTAVSYLINHMVSAWNHTRKGGLKAMQLAKYPTIGLVFLSKLDHLKQLQINRRSEKELTPAETLGVEKFMRSFWTRQVSRPTLWKYEKPSVKQGNLSDYTLTNTPPKLEEGKNYFRVMDPEQEKTLGVRIIDHKLTSEYASFVLSSGIRASQGNLTSTEATEAQRQMLAKMASLNATMLYYGTRNHKILYHVKTHYTFLWIEPHLVPVICTASWADLMDTHSEKISDQKLLKMVCGQSTGFEYSIRQLNPQIFQQLQVMGKQGGYETGQPLTSKDFPKEIRSQINELLLKTLNDLDDIYSITVVDNNHLSLPKQDPAFCTFGNITRTHTRCEFVYEQPSHDILHLNLHQRFAHSWIDGAGALEIQTRLLKQFLADQNSVEASASMSPSPYQRDHVLLQKTLNPASHSFCVRVTQGTQLTAWEKQVGKIWNIMQTKGIAKQDIKGVNLDIVIMTALMRGLGLNHGHYLEAYDLDPVNPAEKGICPVIVPRPEYYPDRLDQKLEMKEYRRAVINACAFISEGRSIAKMGMGPVSGFSLFTRRYNKILESIAMFIGKNETSMISKPKLMYSRLSPDHPNQSAFYTAMSDVYEEAVIIGAIYENQRTHATEDTLFISFDIAPDAPVSLREKLIQLMSHPAGSTHPGEKITQLITEELQQLEQVGIELD